MAKNILAVGIDPAKRIHRGVAVLYPDDVVLNIEFANTVESCLDADRKFLALAERHGAELIYGIEDHRLYGRTVTQVLTELKRPVRVVNPLWSNRQRAFYGQDKSDSVDARSIAAVVIRRDRDLPDAADASELAGSLREAERYLQDLAERRTITLNRLHRQLTEVYTYRYLDFFAGIKNTLGLKFFRNYPVPQRLAELDPDGLAAILFDLSEGRLGPHRSDQRLDWLRRKATLILEASVALRSRPQTLALDFKAELIQQLCDELLANHERTLRLRRMLRNQLLPASGQTITTIPGIGDVLGAAILGEIGDIRRFRSRDAFAKYNGTAPASKSTGGKERHCARRSCNHRLKRAFGIAATAAILHDQLAKSYFQKCRARGLTYIDSMKRIARRMSDIVYAVLKSGQPYDKDKLATAIAERADKMAANNNLSAPEQAPLHRES